MRVAQRLRLRHPRELGLLERPVLDAELLGLVDGRVGRDRLGTPHHVDGIEVELACHPRGLLVLAVAEHSDAGDQHYGGIGAANGRAVRRCMPVVVRLVVGPVGVVQLGQPGAAVLEGRSGGEVEHHRLDLGPQEVIRAAGSQRGEPGVCAAGQEVEHARIVGEVTDLGPVGRREASNERGQFGGPGEALLVGQCPVAVQRRAEGLRPAVGVEVALDGVDDLQRIRLRLGRGVTPRGDAVAPEDGADRLRVALLDLGDVQPELKTWSAPGDPHHPVAEDLLRQRLPVGRGRQRNPRVGVQVIDVRGVDEAVHRGVDRRRRAAAPVQAVIERRNHLVLAVDTGVHVDQGAHAVQPQHCETVLGQCAEVSPGSLDPQQVYGCTTDGINVGALGRGVSAGVVGVLGVRAKPVRAGDQVADGGVGHAHAPHDDCVPPTRSASTVS